MVIVLPIICICREVQSAKWKIAPPERDWRYVKLLDSEKKSTARVYPRGPSVAPNKSLSRTAAFNVYNRAKCGTAFISREVEIGPKKFKLRILRLVLMI